MVPTPDLGDQTMLDKTNPLASLVGAIEASHLDDVVEAVAFIRGTLAAEQPLPGWQSMTFEASILWDGEVTSRIFLLTLDGQDDPEHEDDDRVFFTLGVADAAAFVMGHDVSGDEWRLADPCTLYDKRAHRTQFRIAVGLERAAEDAVDASERHGDPEERQFLLTAAKRYSETNRGLLP